MRKAVATILFICIILSVAGQQPVAPDSIMQLPKKYLEQVTSKAGLIEQKLDRKSNEAIAKLQKQEEKIRKKLAKMDSTKAKELFANANAKYKNLQGQLNNKARSLQGYIPSLDTLSTSLNFLQGNPEMISRIKDGKKQLDNALGKINELKGSLQKAEDVKAFIKERKEYLKQQLQSLGFAKELKKLNKQAYYYSQQISEYKALLKDRKRAEQKALQLLSKTKLFQNFMRKNSQLASMFRLPGGGNPGGATSGIITGMQTRDQLFNYIQGQLGAAVPQPAALIQQNFQDGQASIDGLRNRLTKSGSDDLEMPDFKPNNQRTKSLFKRLEYGTNFQTVKSGTWFPATTDLALMVGYRMNDKNVIGVGMSYKMGWGQNIRNISISSEGIGLRSFVDVNLKKTLYVSGGFEYNYQQPFDPALLLKNSQSWTKSGLIGVSKIISLKTKFFKKTKLQLLWDFLSYDQMPRTAPVKFRVGYSF